MFPLSAPQQLYYNHKVQRWKVLLASPSLYHKSQSLNVGSGFKDAQTKYARKGPSLLLIQYSNTAGHG